MEEYIKRDEAFDGLAHAVGGKFAVWILAPRESPSSDLDFFCSCETYQREVAIFDHISANDPSVAYGVASVFTPAGHRKKGYAKHMMRLLHYVLADQRSGSTHIPPFPIEKWGAPPFVPPGFGRGIGSALYSDVGPSFYKSCGIGLREDNGWIVNSPFSTIWPVPTDLTPSEIGVEWITEETEREVWKADAALIRDDVQTAPYACFSFLPDNGVAKFQQARSLFFSPNSSKDGVWGVRIPQREGSDVESNLLSFATWCLDPGREGPQTLLITRLRCTETQFPAILTAAFQAARNFQLDQVEIWNLDGALSEIGAKMGGMTSARDDHLPCLAWYGLNNGYNGEQEIKWLYNEKFCWC